MADLVSIIIPTYNRCEFLSETLDSIVDQSYKNWECLIIDDGSTDYTPELMEFYCGADQRFKYYKRPVKLPKGANSCRNYGFELSIGKFINWFDDDDIMLRDCLKFKIDYFNPDTFFTISTGYYTDEFLKKINIIPLKYTNDLFRNYVLWENKILTPSLCFRKSFLENGKLFKANLERGQETELFSRIFYYSVESDYVVIDKPLFLYRQHSNTKSTRNKNYRSDFRKSTTYIALENLKRSLYLKDSKLIQECYGKIMENFFHSIEFNDLQQSVRILQRLIPLLKKNNFLFSLALNLSGSIMVILNRRIFFLERRIRSYKLKY